MRYTIEKYAEGKWDVMWSSTGGFQFRVGDIIGGNKKYLATLRVFGESIGYFKTRKAALNAVEEAHKEMMQERSANLVV